MTQGRIGGRLSLGLSAGALVISIAALGLTIHQAAPTLFSKGTSEPTLWNLDNAAAAAEGDWLTEDRFKQVFSKIDELDRQVLEVRQAASDADRRARRAQEAADEARR